MALAGACHCTPDDLRAVLRVDRVDDELLWLPGFEDLGPVRFDDGFVLPPVYARGVRVDAEGLRKAVQEASASTVSVSGDPGSGVSTLSRWLVRQAVEDGWRPARWDGHLPSGRAIVLLADPDDGLEGLERGGVPASSSGWPRWHGELRRRSPPLTEWLKSGDHRLIRARTGGLRIGPVDVTWLKAFVGCVQRRAGKRLKLGALDDGALGRIAERRVGPEEAGLRLRARIEAPSRPPLRQLEAAARRRLRARGDDDAGLAAFDAWFPDVAMASLRDSHLDPVALVDASVLAEARRMLESTARTPAETDLLRACLPALTSEASLTALRGSGLLAEADGRTHARLLGIIASALADRVRDDPIVLRRCLVGQQASLLRAVASIARGPSAMAAALDRLDAPSLALATATPDADWLRGLAWTERVVARLVAVAELTGAGGLLRRALKGLDRLLGEDSQASARGLRALKDALDHLLATADSPIRLLLADAPLPSLERMATSWGEVGEELGVEAPDPTPARLRQARALHLARREDLTDPTVWDGLPDELSYPPSWFELARRDIDVARIVLDPSCRRVRSSANDRRKRGPRASSPAPLSRRP